MRKMTYKTLMRKLDNGDCEIETWSAQDARYGNTTALVRFFTLKGTRRKQVEVTQLPADRQAN